MTPKRSAQEQFDKQAVHYNAQWNAWSEESLRWLLEHAQCDASHRLLDVATGTGFTAAAFAPLVAEVTGVDISEGMLRQARERARAEGLANVVFETAAAESLPFPAGSFDRVTCRVAPHHFLSVAKFASEAYRVLRPGGRLLISDTGVPDDAPELDSWQNRVEVLRDPSHVRNYSPSEWREFVSSAGFTTEEAALLSETIPITMRDWLEKGGCRGETATEVQRMFTAAPPEAVRVFSIEALPDGDIGFRWLRIMISARKPV